MNRIAITFALGAAILAAGCQSGFMAGPSVRQQSGVEGNWVDTSGEGGSATSQSTFAGGSFTTIAIDTGKKASEGSYRYLNSRVIEITIRSIVRNSVIRANCALVSGTQMNCTTDSGRQFTLVRRRGVS